MHSLGDREISVALAALQATGSVSKYLAIQRQYSSVDVTKDADFRKDFNAFYRVSRRTADWYSAFYGYFEQAKTQLRIPTFGDALLELRERTGRLEASFSSKIVATFDPSRPVLDRVILEHLQLRLPYYRKSDRLHRTIEVYSKLDSEMQMLLESVLGRRVVTMFDDVFTHAATSVAAMKKLDFVLWQHRARGLERRAIA